MKKIVHILTPRSRKSLRSTLQVSVLSAAALGLVGVSATAQTAAPSPQQSAEPAAAVQVDQVKAKLLEVDARIRAAQQKASQVETVKEKRDNYEKTLRTAMVNDEPKVKPLLEKQDELISALQKSEDLRKPADQRSPEFQQRFQEYQKLSAELSPIAQKTSEKPEVAQTYKEFETVLTSEMQKVEPAVPQLLQQRGELISQYRQIAQPAR
jgi:chromosome segregation ATPase